MSDKEATAPREIVIIRRKGGDDDEGKKGGAWKIAFADFMTALMAFFLVMWLINSADKQTITQVATYFNPLRLTDKTTSDRGVHDMSPDPSEEIKDDKKAQDAKKATNKKAESRAEATDQKSDAAGGRATPDSNDKARRFSDEELFSDPYGVLSKLASQAVNAESKLGPGALKADDHREGRGDAWRDPFDPSTWRPTRRPRSEEDLKGPEQKDAAARKIEQPVLPTVPPGGQQTTAPTVPPVAEAAAKELAAEIAKALQSAPANLQRPELSVEATPEGLLISLTDKSDFGMFSLGSAEPRPELVVLMDLVAKTLASKQGGIVVRGHTDGRPFRGGASDNWRLSTSRAHMTQYMLVRGGVPERRIERVEGYADQKLRVPEDPESARNRRIEILLRVSG